MKNRCNAQKNCGRAVWYFVILILFLLSTTMLVAADFEVNVIIDQNRITENRMFTLSIEVSGEGAAQVSFDPQFPASMDQFSTFLGRGGESSNFQLINGKMSISKSIQYNFMATKVGTFTIDPIEIKLDNQTYQTKPITIEIVKATVSAPPSAAPGAPATKPLQAEDSVEGNLFLKATVNKKNVYQNEPVVVSYKIYTRVNITSYSIEKSPNTAGFWTEEFELPQQPRLYDEVVNGRQFKVAEIKKVALFPTELGTKTIDPLIISCDVRVSTRRRSRDLFSSFFDDPFFARTQRYQIVSTPPITINVQPLPVEGKPKNFSGAVGQFNLSANIDRQEVETNESIKLKVSLSGRGNIKILPNPLVQIPEDFEQYGPTSSQKINRENDIISGSKSFEYVLIPRQPGTKKIKPIEFAHFDIGTKSYKTLITPEIIINVKRGKKDAFTAGTGFTREEIKLLGQDIRYIHQNIPEFTAIGNYFYQTPVFLVLFIAPLLLLLGAVAYRQRTNRMSGDLAYARSKMANRIANDRLKSAKKYLAENTQKEFYAEISRALFSFLANKLNLDEAGIMTDQIKTLLKEKGVKETTIDLYLNCIQMCDFQRFAPSNSKIEEMKKFYHQAKTAIVNLQREL